MEAPIHKEQRTKEEIHRKSKKFRHIGS